MIVSLRSLQSRSLTIFIALLLSLSWALTGLPTGGPQSAAAYDPCDPALGANNFSQICGGGVGIPKSGRPSAQRPGGGGPYCTIGRLPWRVPRDYSIDKNPPAPPKLNSLLIESLPYDNTADDFWKATLQQIYAATRDMFESGNFYSSSFYWHGLYRDLVAASLFIERYNGRDRDAAGGPGVPAGTPIFHFRSDADRNAALMGWVVDSKINGEFQFGTPNRFGIRAIRLDPEWATYAWVWESPVEAKVATNGRIPTPSEIRDAVARYFSQITTGEDNPNFDKTFLWMLWVDSAGFAHAAQFVKDAVAASYVSGHPYEVWMTTPPPSARGRINSVNGFYFWSKNDLNSGVSLPPGTRWTVRVVIPNRRTGFEGLDLDDILSIYKSLIRQQLSVQWNQLGHYLSDVDGVTRTKGSYVIPVFAYPSDRRSLSVCGSPTYVLFNRTISRQRTSNPETSCDMAAVNSNAAYRANVRQPAACFLWFYPFKVPPPPLNHTSWERAASGAFDPAGYRSNLNLTVPVGQSFTLPIPDVCPRQYQNINGMATNIGPTDFTLRQVGATVEIGSTVYALINRTRSDCRQYGITLSGFTRTALSRAQLPVDPSRPFNPNSNPLCSSLSPTEMALRCGVVVELLDETRAFNATSNPYVYKYRVSLHTWWDGEYITRVSGSWYRGLFAPAYAVIPARYLPGGSDRRIWQWGANYKNLSSLAFVNANRPIGRSGWPIFSSTSPDGYGAPLWDATGGQGGAPFVSIDGGYTPYFDVFVTQIQPGP